MNFIKIIILGIILFFSAQAVFAENHEEKNIVDQAKEINEQIKNSFIIFFTFDDFNNL